MQNNTLALSPNLLGGEGLGLRGPEALSTYHSTIVHIVTALLLTTSANANEPATFNGQIFGTTYQVTVRDLPSSSKEELNVAITNRLQEIDNLMSTWKDDSEISRFNRATANEWFEVHPETAQLVQLAQEVNYKSHGMFDITVSPLVRLWNFGAGSQADFVNPTEQQINTTLSRVGSDKLDVRLDPPALRKSAARLELDLSAIAKGYAVDAISQLLEQNQVQHFMVEIGGEVRASGTNQDGSAWRIGIEAPVRGKREIDSVVSLSDSALATSGDYRNFHEIDGVMVSHTINPKTGRSAYSDLASVTVIAKTCAEADAYATAIKAMGYDDGLAWSESNQIKAMLLRRTEAGTERTMASDFPPPIIKPVPENKSMGSEFLKLFLVTAAVFGIAIVAMSIGTIIANRRLQGSCGGMANLQDEHGKTVCELCTRPSSECSGNPEADLAAADATGEA